MMVRYDLIILAIWRKNLISFSNITLSIASVSRGFRAGAFLMLLGCKDIWVWALGNILVGSNLNGDSTLKSSSKAAVCCRVVAEAVIVVDCG